MLFDFDYFLVSSVKAVVFGFLASFSFDIVNGTTSTKYRVMVLKQSTKRKLFDACVVTGILFLAFIIGILIEWDSFIFKSISELSSEKQTALLAGTLLFTGPGFLLGTHGAKKILVRISRNKES